MKIEYDIGSKKLVLTPTSFIDEKIIFEISNKCMDYLIPDENIKELEKKIKYNDNILDRIKPVDMLQDIINISREEPERLYFASGYSTIKGYKQTSLFNWLPIYYILKFKKNTQSTIQFTILANCGPTSIEVGRTITFHIDKSSLLSLYYIE